MPAPLLELHAIAKRYPGVTALDGVDFSLLPGEVHYLVSENGAGILAVKKSRGRPDHALND